MAKYTITYSVELNVPEGKDGRMEAYYWHDKLIRQPDTELPDNVHWVRTMPIVEED